MQQLRKERRTGASLLALFSLFVQLLLPLLQASALARSPGDGFSLPTIACTLYGAKFVNDASGKIIPPDQGGDVECPVCVAHAIGMAALDTAVALAVPAPQRRVLASIDTAHSLPVDIAAPSRYRTRAPPVLV